jgi:hypothetical protein
MIHAGVRCCRTGLENAHRTACGEVLYRLHPWFGREVFIHDAIDKIDGVVFRCSVDGSNVKRLLEVPAWMFDRAACASEVSFTSVPAVSLQALNALSSLLDQVLKDTAPSSKAPVPSASRVSHDQNQGETHGAEDDGVGERGSAQAPRCTADGFVRAPVGCRRAQLARPAKGCAPITGRPDDAADPGACADKDNGRRS